MTKPSIKTELIQECLEWLQSRNFGIDQALEAVTSSMSQEEKSSAGDKHNTGRAMLQLEREKLGEQSKKLHDFKYQLQRIDPLVVQNKISLGSIVKTTVGTYFLSIPAGVINLDSSTYFAIGMDAPIAKLLMGKNIGDTIHWNNKPQQILAIY